jgi:hypothetical protein
MMSLSQHNNIQNPLASREKGYKGLYTTVYNPTPSFPGNFEVRESNVPGEDRSEKVVWKLQPCGKSRCQICPLLNCGSVVKSNFTNKKFSVLTNRDLD